MRKQTALWKPKDGRKIRICDMNDDHLRNTIRMIKRACKNHHHEELMACMSITFNGDMAQLSQEQFIAHSSWKDYLPSIYEKLLLEKHRREDIERARREDIERARMERRIKFLRGEK